MYINIILYAHKYKTTIKYCFKEINIFEIKENKIFLLKGTA